MHSPPTARVGPVRPHPQRLPLARTVSIAATRCLHLVPKRVPNAGLTSASMDGARRAQTNDFSRVRPGTMGALLATRRNATGALKVHHRHHASLRSAAATQARRAPLALPSRSAHAHGCLPPPCAQATLTTATPTVDVLVLPGTIARLAVYSSDGMLVGVAVISVSLVPTTCCRSPRAPT